MRLGVRCECSVRTKSVLTNLVLSCHVACLISMHDTRPVRSAGRFR